MTITYRQATIEDAPAIDRVFRESFCDTFAHLYRPQDLEAFLSVFTLDAWRFELGDERFAFRVAEAEGQVVGYVKLGPPALPVVPPAVVSGLRSLPLPVLPSPFAQHSNVAAGSSRQKGFRRKSAAVDAQGRSYTHEL